MIGAGQLDASKVGGRWLVDSATVDRRLASEVPSGRPLSPTNAWGLLWIAAGQTPGWLSPWALSRVRRRFRDQGIVALVPLLRNRASERRFRAHPSDVERIAAEDRVIRTGISAVREYALGLLAPGQVEVYVRNQELQELARSYFLESDTARPNVVLRTVHGLWPFSQDSTVAPASVVGVDLMASDDSRARREGRQILEKLEARWPI
jgi:hypothetical protein